MALKFSKEEDKAMLAKLIMDKHELLIGHNSRNDVALTYTSKYSPSYFVLTGPRIIVPDVWEMRCRNESHVPIRVGPKCSRFLTSLYYDLLHESKLAKAQAAKAKALASIKISLEDKGG